MVITRRFRGHYLIGFDGAQYNKYEYELSKKAREWYHSTDNTLWYDEDNNTIYEFIGHNTCEGNFVCTYNSFDELNSAYEQEYDNWYEETEDVGVTEARNADTNYIEMTYSEMKRLFRSCQEKGGTIGGYIVISQDSFKEPYPERSRTYVVSSANKAFMPGMGGYSIYSASLDGSDPCVRLERYLKDEQGGKDGWIVEKCYIKKDMMQKAEQILNGKLEVQKTSDIVR